MDNAIIQKIQFEIEQINELLDEASPLFNLCKSKEPDFVEKCGMALILQSFYNGIEKIMLLIMKNKDIGLPNGIKWHKELFNNAFKGTKNRTYIFREELYEQLNDYLQFRHFVRHAYGFQLKWEKMKKLFFDMNALWEIIKQDINIFIENN
ncbi:MAG: hypothetical protein LBV17_11910 [Treponema sp.]|nr:hypothetical protein [Treponema sp.]